MEALDTLVRRAETTEWAGADPYDGLLSPLGRMVLPLGAIARLALIQAVLRSPHVRALVRPLESVNPKGLALFLGAASVGLPTYGEERTRALAKSLVNALSERSIQCRGGIGWGYPFPWQSRYFYAAANSPNAVVTATACWHLLSAAERFDDLQARQLAEQAAGFLVQDLHWSDVGEGALAVSYTPRDQTRVVNVSGLVGRVLARLSETKRAGMLTTFIERAQRGDGSWRYSQEARGGWEDSFHTGFVLEALLDCRAHGVPVQEAVIRNGFGAYRRFFDEDGGARLLPNASSVYDAHSAAQGIITYSSAASKRGGIDLRGVDPRAFAGQISDWAMSHLWVPEQGRFAYQWSRRGRDDRNYLRWVQAWMALGLAELNSLASESANPRIEERTA